MNTYTEHGRYLKDEGGIGGDIQLSVAPGRRFVHQRTDGTWDVITEAAYVIPGDIDAFMHGTFNAREHGYAVQAQVEIMHCRDLDDVGGTEIACDYEYEIVNAYVLHNMREALVSARDYIRSLNADDYQVVND